MKVHRIHRNGETRICSTCHGSGTPLKESRSTLCDNCHEAKSMSDASKIHSKHVKGEGIDCGNCHTFSSGGLVKRGESGEGEEGEESEVNDKNDKNEGKSSNVTQDQNVTGKKSGEHDAGGNKNEKSEGGKSDRDDD
jgi:hypothetical protein